MEKENNIKNEDTWQQLVTWVVSNFRPGELIAHSLLKEKFMLASPEKDEYETTQDLKEALNIVQFEYMTLIDKMRWDILKEHKFYMNSVRGEGYTFLMPCDQVKYAYETTIRDIKKTIQDGALIATNRRFDNTTQEGVTKDNDLIAKMGMMKQLFTGIK